MEHYAAEIREVHANRWFKDKKAKFNEKA